LEKWRLAGSDGLIRLGYAGGTRTHQRDFECAAPAVARILREHPECRLVVFRRDSVDAAQRCLDLEEFPAFAGLDSQIEWRRTVPLRQLPNEMARFDINLAPLETGNVFCEAKSELKYFEAALANIPTVASPTPPFGEAIRNGETGFLARNADEWYVCLKQLVTDPELRKRIGEAAFSDAFSKYGPVRRAELAGAVMERVLNAGGDPVSIPRTAKD
jgi:glycosyltransferase involved in cell wall biosynthesis